ncbi:hypothetical protein [Arenimonas fontis]|uniref:Bacterial Pleckstrin homology domain-containing protein n=1 Tax=Arenimonas fontis TaxID=2608255 RepID=A0A5B2ZG41_9GAMM|nr:hypothetical protein [Arenimonas fontis]KAA2286220.1 hypothetical protein F0415_01615 [Arenimonas fontis]
MSGAFRRFRLPPLGKAPVLFALLLGVLMPVGVAVGLMLQVQTGGARLPVVLGVQALVALIVLAVLLPMFRREVAFDDRRLRVKATWYTREADVRQFDLDQARVLDLREHTEFKPALKTNGFAIPGLQAGHFRLRNKARALCLVNDPTRVLMLPHADGSTWLLSVESPRAVLSVLREARDRLRAG